MGVNCSRCGRSPSQRTSRAASARLTARDSRDGGAASSVDEEREEAMQLLREEFKRSPTVFLISQIMMSVQFFKNFDRDKLRVLQLKQEKEDELNKALRKDKKSSVYLGSPYEVIGEVMEYCRADGEDPCLGHDLEYLIVHDSISVRTPSDEPDPDAEDTSDYQFIMQKCKSEGYARLRLTGRIRPPTSQRSHRSTLHSRDQLAPRPNGDHQSGSEATKRLPQVNEGLPNAQNVTGSPGDGSQLGQKQEDGSNANDNGGNGVKTSSGHDGRPQTNGSNNIRTKADVHHMPRTEPLGSNSMLMPSGSFSDQSTPENRSRHHSTDSPESSDSSADSQDSSSVISNDKEEKKRPKKPTEDANKHQGKGQQFLQNLKMKMDGDKNAHVNLSDEDQTDPDGVGDKTSQKPTGSAVDEKGTTDAKPSNVTDAGPQSASAASQQLEGPQQPTPIPFFNGQMVPGYFGLPVIQGMQMSPIPESYHPVLPGQGPHAAGPGGPSDREAHYPHHVPAPGPFSPQMGAPGPFHLQSGMPGYQHAGPDNPTPFMMHPGAPHFFPPQPGLVNPYLQFGGMYPVHPQSNGWQPGQPIPGDHQPYLPGVPLANQNPAVGVGLPGYPSYFSQPVPQGHPFMYGPPDGVINGSSRLGTISGGRVARKPARAAKQGDGFLKPPEVRHGRRRRSHVDLSRSYGMAEIRRSSTASSQSRFSFIQDSTTTDDDADTPGLVPHHCFRKVRVRIDTGDEDDEDVWREPHYETHRYLSAERFLGLFADRFGELVKLMACDAWLQHGGRGLLRGPVVHCREQLRSGLRTTARITPTLLVGGWPSEQAFEWALRRRPERLDMRRKVRYVWPPQRVVQCILQEVGCNLVPQGSGRAAAAAELEWEVAFQQAEMKLISSLDLVHVHCWAVAKLFFTHFLSEFGCLQERHIRHLMFWQFEKNFRDWRIESLGATLCELLSSLKESVRGRRLEHYFIRKRNLLHNETASSMVSAQEKLQRTMENLLPNIIILMSRLQVRDDAFPTLDWQSLYDTLRMSTTDIMKKLIPELAATSERNEFSPRDSLMFNPHENYGGDDDDAWELTRRQQIEARYRRWLQQQQKQKKRRKQAHQPTLAAGAPMPAFAGVGDTLNTLGDNFQPRVEMVLCIFIRHFSAMAERLIEHKSIDTALMYLDHSLNLCVLLSEEGGSQEAEELRERLLQLQVTAVQLLPPLEEAAQVDTDLLQMAAAAAAPEERSNWTVGPERGHATRRDFNREAAAAAAAGGVAEWQARGGTRPEAEGGDDSSSSAIFGGQTIFGEMRVNPAFVEDRPKDDDDECEEDDRVRTSRGEADGSEGHDEHQRGLAIQRSRSGSLGDDQFIEEEDEDDEEDDEEDDDDIDGQDGDEEDGNNDDEDEEDEDEEDRNDDLEYDGEAASAGVNDEKQQVEENPDKDVMREDNSEDQDRVENKEAETQESGARSEVRLSQSNENEQDNEDDDEDTQM